MPRTIRGRVDTSEERELWWSSVSEDEKWRLRGMIGEDVALTSAWRSRFHSQLAHGIACGVPGRLAYRW